MAAHLDVGELVLQQADGALRKAVGVECLLASAGLQLVGGLQGRGNQAQLTTATRSNAHLIYKLQLGVDHLPVGGGFEGVHLGEDHYRVDTVGPRLGNVVKQAGVPAQAVHVGHGVNRDVLVTIVDKHRQDEVGGAHDTFLDGLADGWAAAVAARAGQNVLQKVIRRGTATVRRR